MNQENKDVNQMEQKAEANVQNSGVEKEKQKSISMLAAIIILLLAIAGGTFAYFAFTASNNNITGTAGTVALDLTVSKVAPAAGATSSTTSGVEDILITKFADLPAAVNAKCVDSTGEYALCQIYKMTLTNNSTGVNVVNVKGSVKFNNSGSQNLSWMYLANYDPSTTYTSATLGSTYYTAIDYTGSTSTDNGQVFVNNVSLNVGVSQDFYLLVWVNEIDEEQNDTGTYSGTITFEDASGKGVTSTFTSTSGA